MPEITLPARIQYLNRLITFVSGYAREKGFSEKRTKEIELVTEETLVNIFKYAYPDETGEVEVSCRLEKNAGFRVKISDNGVPFDIRTIPKPDLNADISDRKIGGLGIFLIRQLADDVCYSRNRNRNTLSLIFMDKGQ